MPPTPNAAKVAKANTGGLPYIYYPPKGSPVQLLMQGSVGVNGANHRDDNLLVQALLNVVAPVVASKVKLKQDGIVGPKTIAAIRAFQSQTFGSADGRIDPLGKSILRLVDLAGTRATLPTGFRSLTAPTVAVTSSLNIFSNFKLPRLQLTSFNIVTTGGFSASIGPGGVAAGFVYISHMDRPQALIPLKFEGLSVGLSTLPVGFGIGFQAFPSKQPEPIQFVSPTRAEPKSPQDFLGPCTILSLSANFAVGGSATIVLFGIPPLRVATGRVAGMVVGIPNIEITMTAGAITKAG